MILQLFSILNQGTQLQAEISRFLVYVRMSALNLESGVDFTVEFFSGSP